MRPSSPRCEFRPAFWPVSHPMFRVAGVLGASLATWMSTAASAQLVTPPPTQAPAPNEGIEEIKVPPAPPPPPAVQEMVPEQPARTAPPPLPDLPYKSLVERDEAGNLKPLTEPLQLSALRRNPMLPAGFVDSIKPYLAERRVQLQTILVGNLDVLEEIDGGMFERVSFFDRDSTRRMLERVKPLSHPAGPKTLGEVLADRGVIDQQQRLFNDRIAREYALATVPAFDREAPEAERARQSSGRLIALYRQAIEEYEFLYRHATVFAAANAASVLEAAGKDASFDDAARTKAQAIAAAVNNESDAGAKLKVFKAQLLEQLTIDQRRAVIRAAFEQAPAAF